MQDNEKKPALRFKGFTDPWEQRKFGEVVDKYEDPVETPHDGYYRLGIRSHAKGTFHSYVEKGHELETAQMYRVAAGNFIVNITFGWEHAVAITNESDAGKLVSHRFPQYSFHDDMLPEFFKYVIADEDFRHWLWLASPGGAGRNRVLKLDEMLNYEMVLPSKEEQQRIAAIFRNLDTLITLHQRKYEKLVNIKKSMLDKMFPPNGASVPEIRFKGFTDPWEQRKLGEIAVFSKGVGYSKNDLCEEGTPIILYGRLYTKYETCIFDVDTFVKEKAGGVYSKGGEVIVPASGETAEDISIASVVVKPGILLGGDLNIVSPTAEYDSAFLALTISSGATHKYLSSLAQGKSVVHLHNADIQSVSAKFPTKREQEKIHLLFGKIDTLITLHQRKLEKLQNIKKSCLEKMFV